MAAIPTIAEEDARRPNREHQTLVQERTRIVNRMKATLIRFGIRTFNVKLRKASDRLAALRRPGDLPRAFQAIKLFVVICFVPVSVIPTILRRNVEDARTPAASDADER